MTEPTDQAMAEDIETAIRAVPGVASIFRTGGIISKVVDAGAQLLGAQPNVAPLVRWEHTPDGPRAEAAIGVLAAAGAAETSRRVHAAIAALCTGRGCAPVEIRLTVVHIDEGPRDLASRRTSTASLVMPTEISPQG